MKQTILYKELSYTLNGIFFKIHNELGKYLDERQYGDAIERELKQQNIPYHREKELAISFEGEKKGRNRVDFLVDEKIIVEKKSLRLYHETHINNAHDT